MIEKLYTVEEVAELASVTGRTIRNYLKSGRLVGRKIGGQWRFPESEVQRLLTGGETSVETADPASENNLPFNQAPTVSQSHVAGNFINENYQHAEEQSPQPSINNPVYQQNINKQNLYPERQATPDRLFDTSENNINMQYSRPEIPNIQAPAPQYSEASNEFNQNYFADSSFKQPESVRNSEPIYNYAPPTPGPLPVSEQEQHNIVPNNRREHASPIAFSNPTQYSGQIRYNTAEHQQGEPLNIPPAPPVYNTPYTPQYPADYGQMNPPVYNQPAPGPYTQPNLAGDNPAVYTQPASMPQYYPAPQYQYSTNTQSPDNTQHSGMADNEVGLNKQEPIGLKPEPPVSSAPSSPKSKPVTGISDFPVLSEIGKKVARFVSEVHECSRGPQICSVIDMHQSLEAAKHTSEKLADIALQESETGIACQSFVEFDERYYVARYTLFGSSEFLFRCIKLIG